MIRHFKLKRPEGDWPGTQEVTVWYHDQRYETESDEWGNVEFDFKPQWIDKLDIEGRTVKKDWDIGTRSDLGEIIVEDPTEAAPSQESWFGADTESLIGADQDSEMLGQEEAFAVHGQLFYHDGTLAKESVSVAVQLDRSSESGGGRYEGFSRDDGSFHIPTGPQHRKLWVKQIWVNKEDIGKGRFNRTRDGHYTVIMPKWFGFEGPGDGGGLVTGKVIDSNGAPLEDVKISAEVDPSNLLGFLGGEYAETYSEAGGRFVLQFTGGMRLRRIFVDGRKPLKASLVYKEESKPIEPTNIKAGTFHLELVREKRFFGLI